VEWGASISNMNITDNVISGQTFVGDKPAGQGTSNQWTLWNVPRSLVYIGGNNKSNITFTGNQVSGVAGGINSEDQQQGNVIVNIDADGATIEDNYFAGNTAWTAASLRTRGTNTIIQNNTFAKGAYLNVYVTLGSSSVEGGAEEVKNNNTFSPNAVVSEDNLILLVEEI